MSGFAFAAIAIFMLGAAVAAATLQRLIHAALTLALANIGLAALFFFLGAEFLGLVQVFVYVGAVAILIVFTILLTRRESETARPLNFGGIAIALTVFATLAWCIFRTPALTTAAPPVAPLTVRRIGEVLMSNYAWPLLCLAVLLTAALIGALLLVMEEKR